jgi:hypothetical protein
MAARDGSGKESGEDNTTSQHGSTTPDSGFRVPGF